jgi:Arc/MetJ-type ribon-helix-helix transcriptional regulator
MAKDKPPIRMSPEAVYDQRSKLVREAVAKENAANDAKTARLRALRLAKEAEEPAPAPAPKRGSRVKGDKRA